MLCARCNTENSGRARFCSGCGSPLPRLCAHCGATLLSTARFCEGCGSDAATPASNPSDNQRGPALTPHADKELEAPYRAAAFQQTTTQSDPAPLPNPTPLAEKLSTDPRPLYVRPVATVPPVRIPSPARASDGAGGLQFWQWGLAGASAALFWVNFGIAIGLTLAWLIHHMPASAIHPFVYFALTGAGVCGLALALPDTKTTLTVIAGSVLPHSVLRMFLGGRARISFDWLLVLGLAAGAVWWIWLMIPRERGDAGRLSIALTVLGAGYLLAEIYIYARYPDAIHPKSLAILAIVAGSLVGLRVWLPGMIGDGGR